MILGSNFVFLKRGKKVRMKNDVEKIFKAAIFTTLCDQQKIHTGIKDSGKS